jgi:NarL family two-component system sensor histidine kinase LiaS
MAAIRRYFQGLHWKLTLSYTLVTVAALVIVLVVTAAGMWFVFTNSDLATIALLSITRSFIAPSALPYLESSQPDIQGLVDWLEAASGSEGLSFQSPVYTNIEVTIGGPGSDLALLVLDRHLEYLGGAPDLSAEAAKRILAESGPLLAAALVGEVDHEHITYLSPDRSLTLAVPVTAENGDHLGLVVLRLANPPLLFFQQGLSLLGKGVLALTIVAGFIGAIFGSITARWMTNRIKHISQTTDDWSRGNFSAVVHDRSGDELGQLAGHLNQMAEQLQDLLHARQELAAMGERSRLARDLHDSVKQQVFATVMKIGAARAQIEDEPKMAGKHLDEAERLARQAQTELAATIREFQPIPLGHKGLALAITEQVDDWSRLNRVRAKVDISRVCNLPKELEQALIRVTQEALANIARHSQATSIEVDLACNSGEVVLTIADNGVGFNPATVKGRGVGLHSMRERIETLGGDFYIESKPGDGTRLTACCQIEEGSSI